ncbi:MAG: hypothetical protein AN484_15430 [Aphanizomenon flos-aquae WA102]|uniref:Uncharacterized protein n=1 Tax=Aphanizomenon flos-aquae WA102 TaxID=1710896 RepID=A0A1B7X0H6_APHFL|nr:MAG: hypothetical protein AN484_15430 [Aphanizomenon flos-aquae WA102]
MKRFDAHALVAAINAGDTPEGWNKTTEVVRLLGYTTRAGVSLPLARIVKAGYAEQKTIRRGRFIYRLSPRFKTWAAAKAAAEALDKFKAPAGWVTLSEYARKHRRTVRGVQYRIDGTGIEMRVFRNPRSVPYYRRTDLDRLTSKAS